MNNDFYKNIFLDSLEIIKDLGNNAIRNRMVMNVSEAFKEVINIRAVNDSMTENERRIHYNIFDEYVASYPNLIEMKILDVLCKPRKNCRLVHYLHKLQAGIELIDIRNFLFDLEYMTQKNILSEAYLNNSELLFKYYLSLTYREESAFLLYMKHIREIDRLNVFTVEVYNKLVDKYKDKFKGFTIEDFMADDSIDDKFKTVLINLLVVSVLVVT